MVFQEVVDHRADWAQRDLVTAGLERRLRELAKLDESGLIAADLEEIDRARAALAVVFETLSAALDAWHAAKDALAQATETEEAGSLDAKTALANTNALVVARAKRNALARSIPSLTASVNGARERVTRAVAASPALDIVDESRRIVSNLLEYVRPQGAFDAAREMGRLSNAERSKYWELSEIVAREHFAKRLQDAERGPRRNSSLPTMADLKRCFDERRHGFEAERRRVAGEVARLSGQLESLGGAQ